MALTKTPIELSSTPGIVDNSNATAITIDSSENVLVGTTELDVGYTDSGSGLVFGAAGWIQSARSSVDANLYLNKLDNDGEILRIAKDGTTVGSIGTYVNLPYIGKADVNLLFDPTGPHIIPRGTNGGARDAAINLGSSTNRFKDLYLSDDIAHKDAGGTARLLYDKSVNLLGNAGTNVEAYNVTVNNGVVFGTTGGSVTSKTLDDYEEGTWTLTDQSGAGMSLTVYVASYTKIGNQVFFELGMVFPTNSSSSEIRLSLPFTAVSSSDNTGGGAITVTNSGRNDSVVVSRGNSMFTLATNLNQGVANSSYSGKQLRIAGQFTTA